MSDEINSNNYSHYSDNGKENKNSGDLSIITDDISKIVTSENKRFSSDNEHVIASVSEIIHKNLLDELDDDELLKSIEDLQRNTRLLETENEVFLHFLQGNDPKLIEGMTRILTSAETLQNRGSIASRRFSRRMSRSSKFGSSLGLRSTVSLNTSITSDKSETTAGARINFAQKADLVAKEMESVEAKLDDLNRKAELKKFTLKAELDEMAIREEELRGTLKLFEGAFVTGSVEKFTQTNPIEKFTRFMEEWLRIARLTVDKIRLRTSSLKVHYAKICSQLSQKKLVGENLQEVDFEQLQIENKHLLDKIDQRTLLLLEMKKMNGHANLLLTRQKKQMQIKLDEMKEIQEKNTDMESRIKKLDEETEKLADELDNNKDLYDKIKERNEIYEVPDMIDYVRKKAELHNLKKNVRVWERRKQIKDMALVSCIREMKSITAQKKVQQSWFMKPLQQSSSIDINFSFKCERLKGENRRVSQKKVKYY